MKILEFHNNNRELISRYYSEISKIEVPIFTNEKYSILSENIPIRDLTHLETFHIDPSGCVDIDDFMSIDMKSKKIYIHIIDITKYVLALMISILLHEKCE